MKHQLQIKVSQAPKGNRIVQCRNVNIRERLLTRLFGKREKVMIDRKSTRLNSSHP